VPILMLGFWHDFIRYLAALEATVVLLRHGAPVLQWLDANLDQGCTL
jgi:hypothetical protein